MESDNKLILFQEKAIRRVWHNNEWHFSIIDVIEVLTETNRSRKYWSDLKKKLVNEGYFQLSENIGQLKMPSADGKSYKTDIANSKTILRLIMSIPSPKAEPFKQWLSQVGQERIEEIENPELGIERVREIYKAKGYPDDWIALRGKSIEIRKELTDEWKNRGITENKEYSILTAEIAKATFGLTPSEHGKLKGLERQNLRDHMTNLELIFSALGEESTRLIAVKDDAQGFEENRESAIDGGKLAGKYRKELEERTGQKVVSTGNFLNLNGKEAAKQLPENSENTEGGK